MTALDFQKKLHNLLCVTINGDDDDFTRYCAFELSLWPEFLVCGDHTNDLQYCRTPSCNLNLNIIAGNFLIPDGVVYALGKGIFYNESSDLFLISSNSGTSLYNEDDIYMTFTNVFDNYKHNVNVNIDPMIFHKRNSSSFLRMMHRRFYRLDPRTTLQCIAESFFSQTIEPILYRAFLDAGWVLLHAAGLEKNGHSVLIFGPQNIGKTTLSVKLAKRGWNMLGDDMCLVNSLGQVLSHPKPLKIENEHLTTHRELYNKIKLGDSFVSDKLSPIYRELVKRKGHFEFKVSPLDVGINLANEGKLYKAIFLQRSFDIDNDKNLFVKKISENTAIRLTEQHVAAEIDVNKIRDKEIRCMFALHSKKAIATSLLTPKACCIIKEAFRGMDNFILNMQVPNDEAVGIAEKLISQ